jgi:hypothetical protein
VRRTYISDHRFDIHVQKSAFGCKVTKLGSAPTNHRQDEFGQIKRAAPYVYDIHPQNS